MGCPPCLPFEIQRSGGYKLLMWFGPYKFKGPACPLFATVSFFGAVKSRSFPRPSLTDKVIWGFSGVYKWDKAL